MLPETFTLEPISEESPAGKSLAAETPPRQSLREFFADCNGILQDLKVKLKNTVAALPDFLTPPTDISSNSAENANSPGEESALPCPPTPPPSPVDDKKLRSVGASLRAIECAARGLRRLQEARIASEEVLRQEEGREEEELKRQEGRSEQDWKEFLIYRDTVNAVKKAREWRRIAKAHMEGRDPYAKPVTASTVSGVQSPQNQDSTAHESHESNE